MNPQSPIVHPPAGSSALTGPDAAVGLRHVVGKAGGKLCLNSAVVPGDGPRGRCVWHGGTGNTGLRTAAGKKRIGDAQRLRWARYRLEMADSGI